MAKIKQLLGAVKLSNVQIEYLKARMDHFAQRNPSSGIKPTDYGQLYFYGSEQEFDKVPNRRGFQDSRVSG